MTKHPRDKEERANLRYEAEHTRPANGSVFLYLVILAVVAFLLLLMAYFMQQRTNKEAMDSLQQTSSSAVQSLQNLIAERDGLKDQVRDLEEAARLQDSRIEGLEQAVADAQRETAQVRQEAQAARDRAEALNTLNELRALYNKSRYKEARALLEGDRRQELRDRLSAISQGLSDQARQAYDPLAAFDQLCKWLGAGN